MERPLIPLQRERPRTRLNKLTCAPLQVERRGRDATKEIIRVIQLRLIDDRHQTRRQRALGVTIDAGANAAYLLIAANHLIERADGDRQLGLPRQQGRPLA